MGEWISVKDKLPEKHKNCIFIGVKSNQGSAVLCVQNRPVKPGNLRAHFLGNRKPRRVVARAVYIKSRRQLFKAFRRYRVV